MKGFMKKFFLLSGFFGLSWLFFAQSCMTFRKSDAEEKKEFAKSNVTLRTGTLKKEGWQIHYAITGEDSLPTLFFIHGSPGNWNAFAEYMKDSQLLKKFRMVSIDRPSPVSVISARPSTSTSNHSGISPVFTELSNHKPMFLAGHSLGGPLVIKLGADNPKKFSGLVILSGSIDPKEEEPEKWRPWLFNTSLNFFHSRVPCGQLTKNSGI